MKQIAGIVKTNTQNRKAIYKVLKMDKVPDGTKVLLAFLGHPRFVTMFKKDHPSSEVEVLENKDLAWLYDGLDYEAKLVDPVNIKEIKETLKDMKFDYIIMNPPYNGNLHLKILEEAMKHSDNVVNLSPVNFVEQPCTWIGWNKTGLIDKALEHIESLEILDHRLSNDLFGLGNQIGQLAIWNIKNEKTNFKQTWWKKEELSLASKMYYSKSLWSRYKKVSEITSSYKQDMYKWHEEDIVENCYLAKPESKHSYAIEFSSKEEVENFRKSFKCWPYTLLVKRFKDINPAHAPYMGNEINPRTRLKGYESEWTDEDFYKFFDLTADEIKIIEDTMKKYEV